MAKRKRISKSVDQGKDPCDLNLYSDEVPFTWSIENIASSLLKDRYIQIIILLTIIGFLLRFYNIGFNSLWLDEAVTYHFASLPPVEIAGNHLKQEQNSIHPCSISLNLSCSISEFRSNLEDNPALAGTFLIPVFYLLGKEFKDKNCGLICATLATFSVFLLIYFQEARAYTLALLFASLSILFFLKQLITTNGIIGSSVVFFQGLHYGLIFIRQLFMVYSFYWIYTIFSLIKIIKREK